MFIAQLKPLPMVGACSAPWSFMISRWLQNPGKASVFQLAHSVYDFSIQDLKQRTDA